MTAVDRIFGFYGAIWDFFTLPEVTTILDEHAAEQEAAEQEAAEQEQPPAPDTAPPAEPQLDWPGLFKQVITVLHPFEEALWKVSDLVLPLLMAHEERLSHVAQAPTPAVSGS